MGVRDGLEVSNTWMLHIISEKDGPDKPFLNSYAFGWLLTLPLEIVAAAITVGYWSPDSNLPTALFVTIFLGAIVIINLFGVKGYGEAEFTFSILKITAVIGFM